VEVEPRLRGHAIECRINAENPYRDFLPGPGRISGYREPGGPFVRTDAGVTQGRAIPGEYDSLIAKLVVWGEDRERARRRMLRALSEYRIEGVPSTIPFHRWVLDTEEFREGRHHTRFVEMALERTELPVFGQAERAAAVAPEASQEVSPSTIVVEIGGKRVPVRIFDPAAKGPPAPPAAGAKAHHAHHAGDVISAPMQGTILQVLVEEGQTVAAGDVLCILEAMKMENHIVATREGTISSLPISAGQVVDTGQTLAVIEAE
jgi:acetyl-CoA/propionyl-CoA carboxylase biotin carboxyl carrier protein